MGSQITLIDLVDSGARLAVADAAGTALVIFEAVRPSEVWRVTRVTVSSTSSVQGPAVVYIGDPSPQNARNGTRTGIFDIDDSAAPLIVPSTEALQIQWTGMSAGAVCTAIIQYEIFLRFAVPTDNRMLLPV